MLHRAETKIVNLERALSTGGGMWAWEGDIAGLKQEAKGGKSIRFGLKVSSLSWTPPPFPLV